MKKYLSYLPEFFSGVAEFRALGEVFDRALGEAEGLIDEIKSGIFIDSASGEWLSRHEALCSVKTKYGESDEERRFRLMTVTNSELPYTMNNLKEKLRFLLGSDDFSVECDSMNCTLTVTVGIESQSSYDQVSEMLREIVPANMALYVIQQYRMYSEVTSLGYTHEKMAEYSYKDHREGNVG